MSGTLQRLGSIRRSLRHPKKLLLAPEHKQGNDVCTSSSMPDKVEEVGLKGGSSNQTYFRLSVADASISVNASYRPTHLRLVVCRRKTKYRSEPIAWEPSFKCTSTGSIVWPHPFECIIAISPPAIKDASTGTLRHKDVTISLQNIDKTKQNSTKPAKKNKKTLAKVRLNLTNYYESAGTKSDSRHEDNSSVTHKPVSFKLRLRPESSKIANASINLTIQRTNYNPSALLQFPQESPEKELEGDEQVGTPNSHVLGIKEISENKFLPEDESSDDDTISQKSQSISSLESPIKVSSPLDKRVKNISPLQGYTNKFTGYNERGTAPSNELNSNPVEEKTDKPIPNVPPPLPPRDWQKSNSSKNLTPVSVISSAAASTKLERNSNKKHDVSSIPVIDISDTTLNTNGQKHDAILGDIPKSLEAEKSQDIAQDYSAKHIEHNQNDPATSNDMKANVEHILTDQQEATINITLSEPHSSYEKIFSDKIIGVDPEGTKEDSKSITIISTVTGNEDLNKRFPDHSIFATPEKPSAFKIKVPPSPVMRPNKQNQKEKLLIEWANKALSNQDPPIKITNLFTSWQNGLGFCALIRIHFPDIIPPINQLKTEQRSQNCQLAIGAAGLIGVETSLIISNEDMHDLVLDKTVVKAFLQELKTTFQNNAEIEIPEEDVNAFQCKWYKEAGFFAESAANLVLKEQMAQKKCEEEAKRLEEAEKERCKQKQLKKEREETRKKLYEKGKQFDLNEKDRRIDEVQDLIKDAHNSVYNEQELSQSSSNLDVPDHESTENSLKKVLPDEEQASPDSEPTSSTSTTQEYQSCKDTSTNSGADEIKMRMPESKTIMEELSLLTTKEARIAKEKDELEEVLREEEYDPNEHEIIMQKWMKLVNEKNSVVRRQMQLNIKEKEKIASYELGRIQQKLQSFNGLDESRKTDAMKEEEQKLIESHVALVNKKNELVLQLDTQERAIADDERIQALVARRDFITLQREEGCVLQ